MGCDEVSILIRVKSSADAVLIQLFTTAYRKVNEMVLRGLPVGFTPVQVPLMDRKRKTLSNGVYYLRVITPQGSVIRKLVVLK
jgi:hypothetical protein